MKLTRHARIELLILTGLALGSCDSGNWMARYTQRDASRLDIADVNARNALDRITTLEGRVEEMESKLRM